MNPSRHWGSRWAWVPIPVLLVTMLALKVADWRLAYESQFLLMMFNFVFSTLTSISVVVLVGRSFLSHSTPGLLLLGCGVLFWGFAGTISPALLSYGGNVTISIHNILVCLSSFCHLAGAAFSLKPGRVMRRAVLTLAVAYTVVVGVTWLVTIFVLEGWMPIFFIQGLGGTPLRQIVLGSTVLLFACAALLLWTVNRQSPTPFVRWYVLSLLLVATGLLGVMIQSVHGSILNWTGRSAQFLGGAYMLMAAIASVRESGAWTDLSGALEEAREAARLSEQRYRMLAAATFEGIAITEQGMVLDANEQLLRMLGYGRSELIGLPVEELLPAEDRERVLANIREGRESHTEHYILRKDGTRRTVETHGYTAVEGRRTVRYTALRDITAHKRADEILQQKEAELREAQRIAHIGSWYWDAKTDVTTGSDELLRIYGFDPATQFMPNFVDQKGRCYPAEDWEQVNAAVQRTLQTGVGYELDVRAIRDNSLIWITTRGEIVRDAKGQITGLRGTVEDITKRKQEEEALQSSESKYRRLFENMAEGFALYELLYDAQGQPVDWLVLEINDAYTRHTGVGREQIMGRRISECFPLAIPEYLPRFSQVVATQTPSSFDTYADAVGRYLHIVTFPVGGCRFASTIEDITERKRAEEDLFKLTEELKRSNADLEQFAYTASHDLQEPLRVVAGFVELLGRRYKDKLDDKAYEYIHYSIDGVRRMQMLIKDLLQYSKIATKGQAFAPANCSVALEQAIHNLHTAIEESGAEITYDLLPTVTSDSAQIGRLFQNLIGNAIKYRSNERLRIHISAERKGQEWAFSVRDNGIGIDPKFKDRIFVVFQRLHTREEYSGTGIGLAICKKIVERHCGRIWVESEPGKGSTFFFTLPAL